MFPQLELAVKEVASTDAAVLTDDELTEAVLEIHRQRAALEAAEARLAAGWDRRRAWAADGARSGAVWLARRTRSPRNMCGALLWLGRAVRTLPLVEAAWEAGDISAAHVRCLARAHTHRSAVAMARDEAFLVSKAIELPFSAFVQVVDYWLAHADPDGADQSAQDRRDRRRVSLDETISGMYSGSIVLDPISGTIVSDELSRLEAKLFEADWAEAKERLGREPGSAAELSRTGDQRRADALVEMARRSSRPDAGPPARPLFTVVLGAPGLSQLFELASGRVVRPAELLPWLDEADLERILFEPCGQRAIRVSRKRTFTGALRRVIEVRDRTCYHDYCEEPASRCQGDHVLPYAEGGMTSQSNGRLACGFHNRLRNHRGPPPPDG